MKKLPQILAATLIFVAVVGVAVQLARPDGGLPAASSGAGTVSSETASSGAAGSGNAGSDNTGSETASSQAEPESAASSQAVTRAQTSVVDFFIEGETERVPSTLYVGKGYSLYVPDDGWTVSEGKTSTTWISTDNDTVGFSVSTFKGTSAAAAREEYIAYSGFEFDDLNGGSFGDPLLGWNEDGDALGIMSAEKNGTVYIIAWTYPMEATEGFGARLAQIAETFEVM